MRRLLPLALVLAVASAAALLPAPAVRADDAPSARVFEPGKLPADARLGKARDLYDKYHPWVPPTNLKAWEAESKKIRERVLVSQGLWPLPPKTPLEAVIHGKIDRPDYTIEKVYFQSLPGHYVTGSLYRPKGKEGSPEKHPAVLCPHGHWPNGRFYDAGDKGADEQIKQGAEKHDSGAHFPLQARCVSLARLGCTVFHYDMIGYADSKGIEHRSGLGDPEAELRLQNHMGLQTWNSIRALDFVEALPEVDPARIGVTGASGGGTQTFMLCAVDPRPACAFPAVMVSTDMQGGCICENADYLRVGLNNIALASLFAPRPMAMSGADDWTINIETKGLPEMKQVWSLYGKAGNVEAKTYAQFKHNYNQVAREMMYAWFNEHLKLGHKTPIEEQPFEPVAPKDLSVWDDAHPVPKDVKNAAQVRDYLTEVTKNQWEALKPTTPEKLKEFQRVVGTAARVLLDDGVPSADGIETNLKSSDLGDGVKLMKGTIGRKGSGEQIPVVALVPAKPSGTVIVGINAEEGVAGILKNGKPDPGTTFLLGEGHAVLVIDAFLTGQYVEPEKEPAYPKVQQGYGGFTFGYNRPVISNRVRDILTAVAAAKSSLEAKRVVLAARGASAPWVLLARAVAGSQVDDAIITVGDLKYTPTMPSQDPNFLPGALKYGGLYGLAALSAPYPLMLVGVEKVDAADKAVLELAYSHSPGNLAAEEKIDPKKAMERLKGAGTALKKEIAIAFEKMPLQDAVGEIARLSGLEIKIDGDGLKLSGYTKNMEQNYAGGKAPAGKILGGIVGKYKDMCVLQGDAEGQLLVTTKQIATKLGKKPLTLEE